MLTHLSASLSLSLCQQYVSHTITLRTGQSWSGHTRGYTGTIMSKRYCLLTLIVCLSDVLGKPQTVNLSSDSVFISGCWDFSPVHAAITNVSHIIRSVRMIKADNSIAATPDTLSVTSILDAADINVRQLKTKLNQLGLSKGNRFNKRSIMEGRSGIEGRYKRSALDFVSNLSDQLFGFVGANKFNNIKKAIKSQYNMNLNTLKSTAENREQIAKITKVLADTSDQLRESGTRSSFFLVCLRIMNTVGHLENIINALYETKLSADEGLISRWVIPENSLKNFILSMTDHHPNLRPIFSSSDVGKFYRVRIATTHSNSTHLEQIVKIPLMSGKSKFTTMQKGCEHGYLCFVRDSYWTKMPLPEYFQCIGTYQKNIMTACDTRPCLTLISAGIKCNHVNSTSFLLATNQPFNIRVHCGEKITQVDVKQVMLLNIPHHCEVVSKYVIIGLVESRQNSTFDPITVMIPFNKIKGFDGSLRNFSYLYNKRIHNELKNIVLPAREFNFPDTMSIRDHLVITSYAIGGLGVTMIIVLFVIMARKKLLKHKEKCHSSNTLAHLFE